MKSSYKIRCFVVSEAHLWNLRETTFVKAFIDLLPNIIFAKALVISDFPKMSKEDKSNIIELISFQ